MNESEIRNRLLDVTKDAPGGSALRSQVLRRARRRVALTIGATVITIVALVLGTVVAVRSISASPPLRPAQQPTETPSSTSTPLPAAGAVAPGTYTVDRTTVPGDNFDSVRITFTVPTGFEASDLGVLKGGEHGPDGPENTTGVTFWKISSVPADPCHWQRGRPPVGPTVDDLATALAHQSRRHATIPTDVTLAGYAGKHLTLRVPAHIDVLSLTDYFPACDQGRFVSWDSSPPSGYRDVRYQQGPNQVDELWILDVHGFRLVIDASYWRYTPAGGVAEVHRIVRSIRIQRGA
jgi:hypothetical protein